MLTSTPDNAFDGAHGVLPLPGGQPVSVMSIS